MYKFTRENGWEEISDFLRASGKDELEQMLAHCGFFTFPQFSIGKHGVYALGIHRQTGKTTEENKKYEFIAFIDVGSDVGEVAIPTLPDYVALINELSPGLNCVMQGLRMKNNQAAFEAKAKY